MVRLMLKRIVLELHGFMFSCKSGNKRKWAENTVFNGVRHLGAQGTIERYGQLIVLRVLGLVILLYMELCQCPLN